MLYLLNRPEEAFKNVDIALKSEHINTLKNDILSPDLYLEKLQSYRMPDHSIKWINMPLYEGFNPRWPTNHHSNIDLSIEASVGNWTWRETNEFGTKIKKWSDSQEC